MKLAAAIVCALCAVGLVVWGNDAHGAQWIGVIMLGGASAALFLDRRNA